MPFLSGDAAAFLVAADTDAASSDGGLLSVVETVTVTGATVTLADETDAMDETTAGEAATIFFGLLDVGLVAMVMMPLLPGASLFPPPASIILCKKKIFYKLDFGPNRQFKI